MHVFLPPGSFIGWQLDDVLDASRCRALIAELEQRGFDRTGERYPNEYRNNDRLVFDDPVLAEQLYAQLRTRLPEQLTIDGARWELCGLNARFRACRYRDGQSFTIHRDGPHVPSDELRSQLTVQLYLDDEPGRAGGRTRFYADPGGNTQWAAIAPRIGSAIVFDHRAWHDGEAVTGAVKHVLRTDAMYRRVGAVEGARDSSHEVIGRHRGYAWRVIVCRDGSIASAGRDGFVRRWGKHARTYELGAGSVTTLVEATDGGLWCGTRSGAVFVIRDDRISRVIDDAGAMLSAARSTSGEIMFATSRGTVLCLVADELRQTDAHDGWAWCVRAYQERFVSCGEDGRVIVHAGKPRVLAELGRHLRALACLPSGELLAGDTHGWVHRIARSGEVQGAVRAHAAAVTDLAVAPDGTWASCSEDGTIKRWRGHRELAAHTARDFVTSVAFDARGDLVCTDYDGAVRLLATSSS